MVRIEVLFPEVCNLYGDLFNIKYLKQCIKDVEIINTAFADEPTFIKENVDMIYMAPMTEKTQEMVIEKLQPYTQEIKEQIEKGTVMLFTGNAMEVLENYIENEDGSKIVGLGIIDAYAKRNMMNRFNSLFLGEAENIKIVGFKSQFSMTYGKNEQNYLIKSIKGIGINTESHLEGIRLKNFMGTYLLGPILVINPLFTKYILKLLGQDENIAFEEESMNAYEVRLKEFEDPNVKYD